MYLEWRWALAAADTWPAAGAEVAGTLEDVVKAALKAH